MPRLFVLLLSLVFASSGAAVTMDWTPIGDPGNACDPQPTSPNGMAGGCFGSAGSPTEPTDDDLPLLA